jgi:hypothetical protein
LPVLYAADVVELLTQRIGVGLNTSLTPLVAEIPRIVNSLQEEQPNVFGDKSAVAEGYMLLDAVFGAGTVLGPMISEQTFERLGWTGCTAVLGLLSISAVIPVVSHPLGSNPGLWLCMILNIY